MLSFRGMTNKSWVTELSLCLRVQYNPCPMVKTFCSLLVKGMKEMVTFTDSQGSFYRDSQKQYLVVQSTMSPHKLTYDSKPLTSGIPYIYLDPQIARMIRALLAVHLRITVGGQLYGEMRSARRVRPGSEGKGGHGSARSAV